jgi:dTDP-4-amino-4,6-dideoxygalactose transaminase
MKKKILRINLKEQYLAYKYSINKIIKKVLNSGEYLLGNETRNFENNFSKYLKSKNIITTSNATDAITLCLKAINIKKDDEVITTPFTAFATINAIINAGAKIVFADINPDTWLIDEEEIIKKINYKTKVIIPVHIFGNVFDVKKLQKKIKNKKIVIVEDASQAHGSKINNKHAGLVGDFAVWSFYPTKNLGGYGDGGALRTKTIKYYKKILLMRNQGMINKDKSLIIGSNSRMDEIQSAILNFKLKFLDKFNKKRKDIFNYYKMNLPKNLFISQKIDNNVKSNYHILQFKYLGNKNKLINYLDRNQIQTNVYYEIPHHLQNSIRHLNYKKGDLKNCEKICKQSLALPCYPELNSKKIKYIIKKINQFHYNDKNINRW